jgi:hypothetical protein
MVNYNNQVNSNNVNNITINVYNTNNTNNNIVVLTFDQYWYVSKIYDKQKKYALAAITFEEYLNTAKKITVTDNYNMGKYYVNAKMYEVFILEGILVSV